MAIPPPDPVYVLRGEMGPVHSLAFKISPDIEHIYAGAESGDVHIWDLQKHREISQLTKFKEPCLAVHMVGDEYLITQRKGGDLNVWMADGSNWKEHTTINIEYCGFCRCTPATNDILFVPMKKSRIGIFSLKTLKIESELKIQNKAKLKTLGDVMSIKACWGDSKYVLVTYESGSVGLWDTTKKEVISWINTDNCPMTIDFSDSLKQGIVGNPTNIIQVFSLNDGINLSLKRSLILKNSGTSILRTRPDSRIFAAGGWDAKIRIFSWKTLKPLAVLDEHRTTIHDIVFSTSRVEAYNSECLMAATGKDGNISLWDLYN